MICCASVVFPAPGAPAMRLKENSGRPPPRIWSSPGTPVGSRRIATRSVMPYVSSVLASEKASGHACRNRPAVKGSPMNVTSNPVNVPNTAPAASVATAGSCRSRQNNDLSKWPFRLLRLARADQPRVFPLRKMQRATSQRIDANLANQRSRHPREVIVGAARRSRESLRARGRSRVLRQHFQRELPQRRVFKGRHAAPRPRALVGNCWPAHTCFTHIAEESATEDARRSYYAPNASASLCVSIGHGACASVPARAVAI